MVLYYKEIRFSIRKTKIPMEPCIHDSIGRWSEWRDSNSRHPGPKPGALPTGPHPDIELNEIARCGQICGQGNFTTFLGNFQRKQLRGFTE